MKINNASGFTLIELIAVIVILGILAAAAIPKYVDMSSDARIAQLSAAAGSIRSVSEMVHGKYIVTTPAPASTVVEGITVNFVNGYAAAASIAALSGLGAGDYLITGGASTLTVSPLSATSPSTCKAVYTEAATPGSSPTIVITQTNCS